jgi:signal transduction histidine kinase
MQTMVPTGPSVEDLESGRRAMTRLWDYLPRGNTLGAGTWRRRHRLLQWVLLLHVPGLLVLGFALGNSPAVIGYSLIAPVAGLVLGYLVPRRRPASFFITGGLVFCSAALVVLTSGAIEAHFHFFIIIGFIALYQDWVPFLWNVTFTVLSHSIGTIWLGELIFAHPAGQANPWLWSSIHGLGVLAACVGMVIFWRITEDEQTEKEALGRQLVTADAEIGRRRFTSDMLVNLARRNQSMLYRQLDIINQLEDREQDPDALSELFKLDHLATRVRRNAESLLVLAGEQPPRTWSQPVALRDVVRAAIAETEDLDRVAFSVNDDIALLGNPVADLTHLLAELTENAVRFSPPDTAVAIRARPDRRQEGGHLLTVEDEGVGMPPEDLAAANELLATPREIDLAVAQRLGFHVVARLAARHGIAVSLSVTPGSGVTAVVALPPGLFAPSQAATSGQPAPAVPIVADALRSAPGEAGSRTVRFHADAAAPGTDGRPGRVEAGSAGGGRRERVRPAGVRGGPGDGVAWVPPQEPPPFAEPAAASGSDAGWRGWWDPEAVPAGVLQAAGGARSAPPVQEAPARPTSSPVPRPRPAEPARHAQAPGGPQPATGVGGGRGLRRRVPQSHLAPELRQAAPDSAPDPLPPYSGSAASALSRYQASRQAAQALVGDQTGQHVPTDGGEQA